MDKICSVCKTSRAVCVTCLCEMVEEKKHADTETKLQTGIRLIKEYFDENYDADARVEVKVSNHKLQDTEHGWRELVEIDTSPFMADEIAAANGQNSVVFHKMFKPFAGEKHPDTGASDIFFDGNVDFFFPDVTIFYSAERVREHLEFNEAAEEGEEYVRFSK